MSEKIESEICKHCIWATTLSPEELLTACGCCFVTEEKDKDPHE